MSGRDKILTVLSLALTALGITFTLFWSVKYGLVMALLLGLLLCVFFILQRRQMSRVQQRLLKLTELVKQREAEPNSLDPKQLSFHKRVLGHLQAQQISIEILHNKLNETSDSPRAQ